ncbi:unnamed protein product [Aphanomyces euteiches]|uniref:Kazal-like domain-containing protein n=1 Tax=Aphanomyces euteiches TaxID=100861 RepID=A0A6G0X6D4_9STRA|nr:hypothetical protein Ae201684_008117 [Aphanomyces euteiches]KAH9074488.1 hypothetical protein Ae201684P_022295 [Aphanomyces euteiches]
MQLKHLFLVAGVAAAQCELGCTDIVDYVCASDGLTYNNSCLAKVAACSQKKNITVVSKGECKTCGQAACTKIYNPVCGSDGTTFDNECLLKIASCTNTSIKLASNGTCQESTSKSNCKTQCIDLYKPVCASNGQTYSNDCYLKNAACDDSTITKVSDGECTGESNSTTTTKAPSTTVENSVSSTTESPKTTVAPTTTAAKSASATVIASVATTIFVALFSLLA